MIFAGTFNYQQAMDRLRRRSLSAADSLNRFARFGLCYGIGPARLCIAMRQQAKIRREARKRDGFHLPRRLRASLKGQP